MSEPHGTAIPLAIEGVIARLDELEVIFGPAAKETVGAVRAMLSAAVAARERGDLTGAYAKIGEAMDRLASIAGGLDPAEAVLMRAVAQRFREALMRGDQPGARRSAGVMLERSGATPIGKK